MNKIPLVLVTLALVVVLALTAGSSATVSDGGPDLRLRTINEELYPDAVQWIDWICDGVADCVALP
jgi:hypothetical protein